MLPERAPRNVRLLFVARFIRLFAYGSLSVVLVFYLIGVGLSEQQTGLLLTFTLLGDAAVSLFMSTRADAFGRRRMLIVGACLMAGAGLVFVAAHAWWLLAVAATIGVISPSGQEVGPFLSIEQAALTAAARDRDRTGGACLVHPHRDDRDGTRRPRGRDPDPRSSTRGVGVSDGKLPGGRRPVCRSAARASLSSSPASRATPSPARRNDERGERSARARVTVLKDSRGIVFRLSALFALDAFGGGFVAQSVAAYWFHLRFGADPGVLGPISSSRTFSPAPPLSSPPAWRRASASSGRWCGPTCRRTSC